MPNSSGNASEPTVFVVDDDPQVRKSLCLIVQSVQLDVESYATAQEFLDNYHRERPGCLVLDVCLPGMSGMELQQRLVAEKVTIPTIMITAHAEVSLAVRAVKAGAIDFIQKPFSRQEMLDRIQQAISRDLEQRRTAATREQAISRLNTLSPREDQIMRLFLAGKNTKKIASKLGISAKTVDFHRWNLLKKMNAENLVELAHYVSSHVDWQHVDDESNPTKSG